VAIGIGGWTARYLGPSALGTLSYAGALVGLLGPLGNLGVKGSLSALLCANPPLPGLLGTALCIELVGTALVALVLVPVALLAKDPVIPALLGLAVLANLFNSAEVFEAELFNRHRGSQVGVADFMQTLLGAVASSAALLLQAPLLLFGALPAFQSLVRGCSLYRSAGAKSLLNLLASARWPAARQLIQLGWPLMLSGFAIMIYMKSDLVMLQWLRSSEEVGQYSVAVRVAESLYFLPIVLSQTFLPRLDIREAGLGHEQANSQVKSLYRLSCFLGFGILIGTLFLLPSFLPLVFGSKYELSVNALRFLAPAGFAVATGCASGAWFTVNGCTTLIALRSGVGAGLNLVLNFLLIPTYGIVGAAIATSASQLVSVYLVPLLDQNSRQSTTFLLFPF
jgi:PST family polysaccharide transporter